MNTIDPVELSAYLDGELTPERAREVEAALRTSPALRTELDALAEADETWRAAARSAAFRPDVKLRDAVASKVSVYRIGGAVTFLLAVRIVPKLAGTFDLELIANGIALALVVIWVIRMAGAGARETNA